MAKPIVKSKTKTIIFWIIIISALVHISSLIISQSVLPQWRFEHLPFHSAVEMSGSVIAIFVGCLLLDLEKRQAGTHFNVLIACCLFTMGIFDGFHAIVHPGASFVWLHSLATFIGGSLFLLIWLPQKLINQRAQALVWLTVFFSLLLGISSLIFESSIPQMVDQHGFTDTAKFMNLIGGLFLMSAAIKLFISFRQTNCTDDLLFVLHCTMFGLAAIMFEQSKLWDVSWWGWHVLRFMAYSVAIWFAISDERIHVQNTHDENKSLAKRVDSQSLELSHAQDSIEMNERKYAAIINNLSEAMVIISQQGIIQTFTPSAERLFGYQESEVIGKNVSMLMENHFGKNHDNYLNNHRQTGKSFAISKNRELKALTKSGELIDVSITISELHLKGELYFIGTIRDDSERVQHLRALELAATQAHAANKAKEDFLANMSHEIRTPMNGIYGSLQLLSQEELSRENRHLINNALFSSKNLLTIINDILDFSKIEAGKLKIEQTRFNLKEIIDSALSDLLPQADKQKISLSSQFDDALWDYWLGDPIRIKQIVLNIISNAVKFTLHGNVSVNVSPNETFNSGFTITITDTGIGMSQETIDSLFNRFEQADSSTTRNYGGTGLGMAITHSLIKLMKGEINVTSKLGQGSRFIITLPLTKEALPNTEVKTNNHDNIPNLSGKLVLVVEDNQINRTVIRKILSPTKAKVIETVNGQDAVNLIDKEFPDFILMDIQMPVMDGVTACRLIREKGFDNPIIAFTANVLEHDIERYKQEGFNDSIAKPIEIPKLYKLVSTFFA